MQRRERSGLGQLGEVGQLALFDQACGGAVVGTVEADDDHTTVVRGFPGEGYRDGRRRSGEGGGGEGQQDRRDESGDHGTGMPVGEPGAEAPWAGEVG